MNRDRWWVRAIGRLGPGVNQSQAQAALDIVLTQEAAATVGTSAPAPAEQVPHIQLASASRGLDELRNRLFEPLRILLVVVLLVLFLACANVANLMLVRGAARTPEIAMRRALGASRRRRSVSSSSKVSYLPYSAALPSTYGSWGRNILLGMIAAQDKTIRLNAALDLRVLAFTVAISLLTVLVFGLAPSFRASRAELVPSLEGERALKPSARFSRFGARNSLVAVQAGVSLVLVPPLRFLFERSSISEMKISVSIPKMFCSSAPTLETVDTKAHGSIRSFGFDRASPLDSWSGIRGSFANHTDQ